MSGSDRNDNSAERAAAAERARKAAEAKAAAERAAAERAAKLAAERAAEKVKEQAEKRLQAEISAERRIADNSSNKRAQKKAEQELKLDNPKESKIASQLKEIKAEIKQLQTDKGAPSDRNAASHLPTALMRANEIDFSSKPAHNVKVDAHGRVTEVDLPNGKKSSFGYDKSGNLALISLASGKAYGLEHGKWVTADGKPANIAAGSPQVDPDGSLIYSTNDNKVVNLNGDGSSSVIDMKKNTTTNTNTEGKVTSIFYENDKSSTFSYGKTGQMDKITQPNGTTFELNGHGQWTDKHGKLANINEPVAAMDGTVQYKDSAGEFANYDSIFGGALIDTDAYPVNGCSAAPICLTDEQLRAEITKYVEAHKLPMDLQHEYFLLTPPGVESCLEAVGHSCSDGTKHAAYCSYHSYISVAKTVIVYANDPYVDGTNCDYGEEHPNGNASDATIGGGLAHEHSESVTDPELNAWYDSKRQEVGDKCRTFKEATEFGEPLGKAPDGSNYNQVLDGDLYWYQQEWSNETGACEQRLAQPPSVTKVTPKTGTTSGGTTVTITGTNFAAPATVKFGATPATEVTVHSSTSISAVSPAGAAGVVVDIVVTTPAGSSAITKKDHFKYKA